MGRLVSGRHYVRRAPEVDIQAVIGQRESPHPDNSIAHQRWDKWRPDRAGLKAFLDAAAQLGKVDHSRNDVLGLDRYLFSDGSMLVISFTTVRVVDLLCSASIRTYLLQLGGTYAPMEARHIADMRLFCEGWGYGAY